MRRVAERIFVGDSSDCDAEGYAILHCCKHPCHVKASGVKQLPKDHPDYLAIRSGWNLYLNMIDPETPMFSVELFKRGLEFAAEAWKSGKQLLFHCNKGESRSASMALLFMAKVLGEISNSSYAKARVDFESIAGRKYSPGKGIELFLQRHWRGLDRATDVKPKVPDKPAKAPEHSKKPELRRLEIVREIRRSPMLWFQGYGHFRDEETRQPVRGRANVLQRRMFEHYRRCQDAGKPCRMVALKYRRAGSSTGGTCLTYMHVMNHNARLGEIGTDYKASSNMFDMVKFFGEHDDFPGWQAGITEGEFKEVEWDERTKKNIATKLEFHHGSVIELYTAKNPESARSAGLQGYHATEVGRWPTGGAQDAGATLTAMRNTLPKKGFHFALEESTAQGAQGAFYDTCRTAKWPEYADWWKQWETCWPLTTNEDGPDLQFVFIFAAWFEDERNVMPVTPDRIRRIKETLDEDEKELIALFGQEGPKGERLGDEVNATVWEQLEWRRAIIKNVCTKRGVDEFKEEYPATPLEAFRASGTPVFDQDGLIALEVSSRNSKWENGTIHLQTSGRVNWMSAPELQAVFWRWEAAIVGARYLVVCDPMSGADDITGTGEKDRHSVLCLRDGFKDTHGRYHFPRLVARVRPPCQWDDAVIARQIWLLSQLYGDCPIVVESNYGKGIINILKEPPYNANLYMREEFDHIRQTTVRKIGFQTTSAADSRRLVVSTAQMYVREQRIDIQCPHVIGEMRTFIIDKKGKAVGGGSSHDDDCLALGIGLVCLPMATTYSETIVKRSTPTDDHLWRDAGE